MSGELSLSDSGRVHMVDVGGKPFEEARAVARARVRMAAATARRLRELPKGDALATARACRDHGREAHGELIPLCHPLALTHVERQARGADEGVEIVADRRDHRADGRRDGGADAASVAALTVYDMAKASTRSMVIEGR